MQRRNSHWQARIGFIEQIVYSRKQKNMSVKFIYGLFFLLVGCSTKQAVVNVQDHRIDFDRASLKEGIPAYGKTEYVYQKDGKNRFKIDFGEPIVFAVADKPYKWGFFQFPGRSEERRVGKEWSSRWRR